MRISITTLVFGVLFPTTSAVTVNVNHKKPVKYINQDQDGEIILRCDYVLGNKAAFKESCDKDPTFCARVTWALKGIAGCQDRWCNVARPNEGKVLDNFQSRFAIEEPNHLRLLGPIKASHYNATYECRVEIDSDTPTRAEAKFELYVRVPPAQVKITGKAQPQLDKPTTLTCSASGQPTPNFRWFVLDSNNQEQEIINKPKPSAVLQASGVDAPDEEGAEQFYIIGETDPERKDKRSDLLTITKVQASHRGKYRCRAYNDALKDGVEAGIPSTAMMIEPTLLNMGLMTWLAIGVGAAALLLTILIIACCCCRKEKKPPGANNPMHGYMQDPNYTAGRAAVTPAKSQITHSTMTGSNEDYEFQKPQLNNTTQRSAFQHELQSTIVKSPHSPEFDSPSQLGQYSADPRSLQYSNYNQMPNVQVRHGYGGTDYGGY